MGAPKAAKPKPPRKKSTTPRKPRIKKPKPEPIYVEVDGKEYEVRALLEEIDHLNDRIDQLKNDIKAASYQGVSHGRGLS